MKKAIIIASKDHYIDSVDPRLFGTFIEPIRNIIYGNVYNLDHHEADENGFRKDVMSLLRDVETTLIRFPGGNYVSNYHWKDGIGPKEQRPIRFDKAWRKIDNNQVGIDEYIDYNNQLSVESMLTINLGTGTIDEAADEVEYCNVDSGTDLSNLRKEYGHEKPHGIKLWCLGNEMDGPWQVGQKTATEYGHLAKEAAKAMRYVDPEIETVVCGSCTNEPGLKSYPEWDATVMDIGYDHFDYISLHRYYSYDPNINMAFETPYTVDDLAYIPNDLNQYLDTVLAAVDFIKGKKRSTKRVNISFDEWGVRSSRNVCPSDLDWTEKVEHSDKYRATNLIDALLFGSIMITFLNRCDRVKIACQSIVIGSMIAADPEGSVFRQTVFYPFKLMSKYGHGKVLNANVESPVISSENFGDNPSIQTAVVDNGDGYVTLFAVNLDLRNDCVLNVSLRTYGSYGIVEHFQMHDDQPLAGNSFANPNRIVPKRLPVNEGNDVVLPKHSFHVIRYKTNVSSE